MDRRPQPHADGLPRADALLPARTTVARLAEESVAAPGRRSQPAGFDSIVQAASGIALLESPGGGRPGALPAQALVSVSPARGAAARRSRARC